MLTLLDRQLIASYLKAYLFCLVSLIGLFVIIDLFTNLDRFTQTTNGLEEFVSSVGTYYGMQVIQIFDRMCEAIVLLAAMFTVAWMQRSNELLPLLSAGVSTRRVVRPVLIAAGCMLSLSVLNQELVLPKIDAFIVERKVDTQGRGELDARGAYENNDILIVGRVGFKDELKIEGFTVVIPQRIGREGITALQAREARGYVPPGPEERSGGWLISGATKKDIPNWTRTDILKPLGEGKYFLKTSEVDFEALTRSKNWYMFVSTPKLLQEMAKTHFSQLAGLAVVFHMRLTRPILGLVLVIMGLSIILRDQNRNVFISAGLCLVLCGVFFIGLFTCRFLGDYEILSPALAAWLPVVIFGPLSLVMFDAVHT